MTTVREQVGAYFFENAPPIVSFAFYCHKNHQSSVFDRVIFYYLPERYLSGFPFKILFFQGGKHVSETVLRDRTYATMVGILEGLPSLLNDADLPAHFQSDGEATGCEGYIYECCKVSLQHVINSTGIQTPIMFTELHDSDPQECINLPRG